MHRHRLILLACIEALIVLVVIYFEPTYGVRGKLWGEAFYDGRPTSYWRCELGRWQAIQMKFPRFTGMNDTLVGESNFYSFSREPGWLESQLDARFPKSPKHLTIESLIRDLIQSEGPKILWDEAASPVLHELLGDSSPHIRRLARIGLKMPEEIP